MKIIQYLKISKWYDSINRFEISQFKLKFCNISFIFFFQRMTTKNWGKRWKKFKTNWTLLCWKKSKKDKTTNKKKSTTLNKKRKKKGKEKKRKSFGMSSAENQTTVDTIPNELHRWMTSTTNDPMVEAVTRGVGFYRATWAFQFRANWNTMKESYWQ